MSARSPTVWLSVVVMMIVVVGTLGIAAAATGGGVPRAAAPTSAAPAAQVASQSTGAPGAADALLTSANTPSPPSEPTGPAANTPMGKTLTSIEDMGIPAKYAFLPDLNANPHPSLTNGHITPLYGPGPAPYGVGEFGLENESGTITPYNLSTPSVAGTYIPDSMSGLSADISGPDEYGVQLNAVLNNVQLLGTPGYEFWTQNVVEYSDFSSQLFFVSNIWNFSGGPLNANTFNTVGPNGTVAAPDYYYGLGGPITITYPFTLNLYLNSTVINGDDAVFFNFTLSNATEFYAGSYDNVTFNSGGSSANPAPTPEYVADGSQYNPIGLPNDFEITLGGPGGGSNFDALQAGAYFGLQYWNTTTGAYATVPSAYGFGSETGETSYGVTPLWGYEPGLPAPQPNAWLTTGASNGIGLWNVSGQGGQQYTYGSFLSISLTPESAFLFIADGNVFNGWTGTNWSLFQWLPPTSPQSYELNAGTYTIIAVLANYDPTDAVVVIPAYSTVQISISLTYDLLDGVYTPLWALNDTALLGITNDIGGNYFLFGNQYLPIGLPGASDARFPWFGLANDYLFPIFQGILLNGTTTPVIIAGAPTFQTYYPSWMQPALLADGLPIWNDLQMMFWNTSEVTLVGSPAIGGWWWSAAYFGPTVSAYNVVFWNSTESTIFQNTFATGGNALYLYGGTDNLVYNNTFTESIPSSANPDATVAAAYGSVGLFEADYGEASDYAEAYGGNNTSACYSDAFCDVVFNNIFDTYNPVVNPYYDPYYFFLASPTCPYYLAAYTGSTACYFDDAFNVPWSAGPNIIGGPLVGGNYYWNYGDEYNAWSQIPYYNYEPAYGFAIDGSYGDFNPLAPVPLYTVTVTETGLPAGAYWYFYVYTATQPYLYQGGNSSIGTSATLLLSGGYYYAEPYATGGGYTSTQAIYYFNVTGPSLSVTVTFEPAYTVVVSETGLPTGTYWVTYWYNAQGFEIGYSYGNQSTANATGIGAGTYTVYAYSYSDFFESARSNYTVTVSGNGTFAVTFEPVYTAMFHVSGLPNGATWLLQVQTQTGNYSYSFTVTTVNLTWVSGTVLSWAVASSGYLGSPASGSFTVSANSTTTVVFARPPTTGTLTATVSPANASVTVDGTAVTGTGGVFTVSGLSPGTHEIVATESGYYTTYTNVSVSAGVTSTVTVSMTAVPPTPGPSSSSGSSGISTTAWLLIAVLAVLAVVFLVLAIHFMGKSKKPPAMTQYSAPASGSGTPPPSGGASPPSGAAPPWSEGGSPPPGAR